MPVKPPAEAVDHVLPALHGLPVFVAGSAVAARVYGVDGYGDVDVFCPTKETLMGAVQQLLGQGYVLDDRMQRVYRRWLHYGMGKWHTNSLRLESLHGVEVNVVYKLVGGNATRTLAQVLESFDFGLLGVGFDSEANMWRDMRSYLFPGYDLDGPLPMMPDKHRAWSNGLISSYNGLREGYRFAKYSNYGYDMSMVAPVLVQGYRIAGAYHQGKDREDQQLLGEIYFTIADRIDMGQHDELIESYSQLEFSDPLDQILEALE